MKDLNFFKLSDRVINLDYVAEVVKLANGDAEVHLAVPWSVPSLKTTTYLTVTLKGDDAEAMLKRVGLTRIPTERLSITKRQEERPRTAEEVLAIIQAMRLPAFWELP